MQIRKSFRAIARNVLEKLAYLWGLNTFGQLGDGNSGIKMVLTQVGTTSGWKTISGDAIAVGAVKTDGTLWTWGGNSHGQLGINQSDTGTPIYSPVQVGSDTSWSDISAGSEHFLALKTDGTIWSWGLNNYGQLGLNDTINRSSPVQIGSDTDWSQISTENLIAGAIKTNGTLWTWGYNTEGSLGLNNILHRSSPTQVGLGTDWSKLSMHITSHAIKTNGTLWGWGNDTYGQIGQNIRVNRSSPVQIGAGTFWSQVTGGDYSTLALRTNGTLWSWGFGGNGELGTNSIIDRSSPVQIGALTTWSTLTNHFQQGTFAAIRNDGTLWAWGHGYYIPVGDNIYRSSPVQVGASEQWQMVSNSTYSFHAINSSSYLYSSGQQSYALEHLGQGETPVNLTPTLWPVREWRAISGYDSRLAVKYDNSLWAWGDNTYGQLGDNSIIPKSSPVQIGNDYNWDKILSTGINTFAIKKDGTLWAWGYNQEGQVGDNTRIGRSNPVQVGTDTDWDKISSNGTSVHALKKNRTLWSWGSNLRGILGQNTSALGDRSTPVQVGNNLWLDISTFGRTWVGIRSDRTMWGTGYAVYIISGGGLGRSSPVQIGSANDWAQVSGTGDLAHAVKINGTLWWWGHNVFGNAGNNIESSVSSATPIQIGTDTNWYDVKHVESWWTSYFLKQDGTLWACGYNLNGEVGDGTKNSRSSPVQIGSISNLDSFELFSNHPNYLR